MLEIIFLLLFGKEEAPCRAYTGIETLNPVLYRNNAEMILYGFSGVFKENFQAIAGKLQTYWITDNIS